MKAITHSAIGFFLALRVLVRPKNGIHALIKFGNVISTIKAYQIAVDHIMQDEEARELIVSRYSNGFNSIEDFAKYEEGTLGGEYYRKMTKLNLVCYPYKIKKEYSDVEYVRERRREIHDLLHVVLNYNTTLVGEASLNSFLVGKAKMPTCMFIVIGIILRTTFKNPKDLNHLIDSIVNAYVRGNKAKSPFAIKWEEYLDKPIEDARAAFGV